MQDTLLSLQHISKNFGEGDVLRDISLDVARGEFVTLLGASGCGKTTTLRIISGLETPDEGTVLLDGRDVTALPPERRPVNTVFQSYALFPHMTVFENMSFGLKLRKTPKDEIKRRVEEAARDARAGADGGFCQTHAQPAFRRPAPAHRHRPRARARTGAAAAG